VGCLIIPSIRHVIQLCGFLIAFVVGFISWYPLLFAYGYGVECVAYIFIIASIMYIIFSSLVYVIELKWNLIMHIAISLTLILLNLTPFWSLGNLISLFVSCYLLSISGYLSKLYNLTITLSSSIDAHVKGSIVRNITKWDFIFGSIGCLVFSFIIYHYSVITAYTLIITISAISLAMLFYLHPFNKIVIDRSGEPIPKSIYLLSISTVFAFSIFRPFIPAYLNYLNINLIIIGIFYGVVILVSRISSMLAQVIVSLHGPHTSIVIRSIVSVLMLLTTATSEDPTVSSIALGCVLILSPFYTIAYLSLTRKFNRYDLHKAEVIYTLVSVPAALVGIVLWFKTPRSLPLISALLLALTLPIISKMRKEKRGEEYRISWKRGSAK